MIYGGSDKIKTNMINPLNLVLPGVQHAVSSESH